LLWKSRKGSMGSSCLSKRRRGRGMGGKGKNRFKCGARYKRNDLKFYFT